jgi:hypothetical protein
LSRNLEFLSRPGCHLCDDARPIARRVAARLGVGLVETDIELDDRLVAEFGLRIPVVRWSGGAVLAEGSVEYRPLLDAGRRWAGHT